MTFTTLKETQKALFIQTETVKTWIPKSWVKKNGELGKKALDKINEVEGDQEWNEAVKIWTFEKAVEQDDLAIIRETEKAVLVNIENRSGNDTEFWAPKSMINDYNFMYRKAAEKDSFLPLR